MNIKCSRCKQEKDFSQFHKNKSRSTGFAAQCKICVSENHKAWRNKNPELAKEKNRAANAKFYSSEAGREKARDKAIRSRYGISSVQYDEILSRNNGMCCICKTKKANCLDHCHQTSILRGGLCDSCNLGLGKFYDSIELLQAAIEYLSGVSPLADNELKG